MGAPRWKAPARWRPGLCPQLRVAISSLRVWPARRRPSWLSSASASAPSPLHPVAWTTRDHTASGQSSEAPRPHVAEPGGPKALPRERPPLLSLLAPEPLGADRFGPSRGGSSPRGPHRILAPHLRLCLSESQQPTLSLRTHLWALRPPDRGAPGRAHQPAHCPRPPRPQNPPHPKPATGHTLDPAPSPQRGRDWPEQGQVTPSMPGR